MLKYFSVMSFSIFKLLPFLSLGRHQWSTECSGNTFLSFGHENAFRGCATVMFRPGWELPVVLDHRISTPSCAITQGNHRNVAFLKTNSVTTVRFNHTTIATIETGPTDSTTTASIFVSFGQKIWAVTRQCCQQNGKCFYSMLGGKSSKRREWNPVF